MSHEPDRAHDDGHHDGHHDGHGRETAALLGVVDVTTTGPAHAAVMAHGRPDRLSEFVQLVERRSDPLLPGSEVDQNGDIVLHPDDDTEAVSVMAHPVVHVELLGGWRRRRRFEGTCGQVTTRIAAGSLHLFQYAPTA
ncbi:hypothetical protein ABZ815_39775 [Nonomuraea sp. NPDC047529]|uniref:hypothetical protein n=1 Tax=Nonomuraea sp. NPDC047529 TaxID=3155623 RepID=UPI0033C24AF4